MNLKSLNRSLLRTTLNRMYYLFYERRERRSQAVLRTKLLAARPRNSGSISVKGKAFFSTPERLDWLWGPISFRFLRTGTFCGGKASGLWSRLLGMPSWRPQGQLLLENVIKKKQPLNLLKVLTNVWYEGVLQVAGSIPDGVIRILQWQFLQSHYGPGVDSASNRNEHQVYFLGVKAAGA